ncbi:hypothetical protein EVAR_96224_1 [Eumeta japonica]|uniref:Uncharacterized protein n=1 Tax=Eumeta variegata TaxID=151549 RepID=A0A4C1WJN4_EUMVA|nr:hypothetical protein EVAR_96224_1 [Eumeta japonica]
MLRKLIERVPKWTSSRFAFRSSKELVVASGEARRPNRTLISQFSGTEICHPFIFILSQDIMRLFDKRFSDNASTLLGFLVGRIEYTDTTIPGRNKWNSKTPSSRARILLPKAGHALFK